MERTEQLDSRNNAQPPNSRHIPVIGAIGLIVLSISSRSATSILTPVWIDSLNNHTSNVSSCDRSQSIQHIDAYAIMFITTFLFFVLFGIILLLTKCICPYLITDRETHYDKRIFAVIGLSDTVSAICLVYASSGCRTAPYLQSLFANFAIPVTFIIRFLVLRKRPTCRKTFCAVLILFAEFTALLPDIFPGLENERARQEEGGASGIGGILWPLCFFFGFIPMGLVSIFIEKAVKSQSPAKRRARDTDLDINVAYCLFWCYLFSLLSLILLFWTDFIPGFGMTGGVLEFCQTFYFNLKCFVGYEGCRGFINVVSGLCVVLNLVNRVTNTYFLRFLEGANYLVIVTSLQTPVVFLFFTLFDENPLKWHPHAYLSTWLSIAALCIMIPAIYIYETGSPEVVSGNIDPDTTVYSVDSQIQTDEETLQDSNRNYQNHPYNFDETSRLLVHDADIHQPDSFNETSRLVHAADGNHPVDSHQTSKLLSDGDTSHVDDFDDTSRLLNDSDRVHYSINSETDDVDYVRNSHQSYDTESVLSFHSCVTDLDDSPKIMDYGGLQRASVNREDNSNTSQDIGMNGITATHLERTDSQDTLVEETEEHLADGKRNVIKRPSSPVEGRDCVSTTARQQTSTTKDQFNENGVFKNLDFQPGIKVDSTGAKSRKDLGVNFSQLKTGSPVLSVGYDLN